MTAHLGGGCKEGAPSVAPSRPEFVEAYVGSAIDVPKMSVLPNVAGHSC